VKIEACQTKLYNPRSSL